jgi:hypothetical protein
MERPVRYKLSVRLEIGKEEFTGTVNTDGTYDSSERGAYWNTNPGERLTISEDLSLGSLDFIGVMGILGDLHTAIKSIKGVRNGTKDR